MPSFDETPPPPGAVPTRPAAARPARGDDHPREGIPREGIGYRVSDAVSLADLLAEVAAGMPAEVPAGVPGLDTRFAGAARLVDLPPAGAEIAEVEPLEAAAYEDPAIGAGPTAQGASDSGAGDAPAMPGRSVIALRDPSQRPGRGVPDTDEIAAAAAATAGEPAASAGPEDMPADIGLIDEARLEEARPAIRAAQPEDGVGEPLPASLAPVSSQRIAALIREQRQLIDRMAEVSARLQLRHQFAVERPGAPILVSEPAASERPEAGFAAVAADAVITLRGAEAAQPPAPVPRRADQPDPAATGLVHAINVAINVAMPARAALAGSPVPPAHAAEAPPATAAAADAPRAGIATITHQPRHAAPAAASPLPAFAAGVAASGLVGVALWAILA